MESSVDAAPSSDRMSVAEGRFVLPRQSNMVRLPWAGPAAAAKAVRTARSPRSCAVASRVSSAAWRISLSPLSRSLLRICGGVMQLRQRQARRCRPSREELGRLSEGGTELAIDMIRLLYDDDVHRR